MRTIIIATLMLSGCAAADPSGNGVPMTAIYSPPVRLGGTGSMMFLPAASPVKLPIEALPHASALIAGKGRFDATREFADAVACRAQVTAIAARAKRRYRSVRQIGVMPDDDGVTIIGPFDAPMRILAFRCEGAKLMREDGMAQPHPDMPLPPMPAIAR